MEAFARKNADTFYFVFRVIIGIVFLLHGIAKIPEIMDGTTPFMDLMTLAALIETVGGAFLIIGLLVRPVAALSAIEMVVAYGKVHILQDLNPLKNGGEPAVLFFAAFLVLIAYGAGKWAIDKKSR